MTEPRYEKTGFLHMRKQRRRSAAQVISAFVFAIRIVQFLYYLKAKFQFCICENKDADQLRSICACDQRLCFRYTDSTIPLLPKAEISIL